MTHTPVRWLTLIALGLAAVVLPIAACTHTTDRVVEPVGVGDASAPTPELSDAELNPLTPVALPPEPEREDYRLVRAPELGLGREVTSARITLTGIRTEATSSGSAGGSSGGGGMGGSDQRPVATGGSY
jgi:hypothetical protein